MIFDIGFFDVPVCIYFDIGFLTSPISDINKVKIMFDISCVKIISAYSWTSNHDLFFLKHNTSLLKMTMHASLSTQKPRGSFGEPCSPPVALQFQPHSFSQLWPLLAWSPLARRPRSPSDWAIANGPEYDTKHGVWSTPHTASRHDTMTACTTMYSAVQNMK